MRYSIDTMKKKAQAVDLMIAEDSFNVQITEAAGQGGRAYHNTPP